MPATEKYNETISTLGEIRVLTEPAWSAEAATSSEQASSTEELRLAMVCYRRAIGQKSGWTQSDIALVLTIARSQANLNQWQQAQQT